VSKVLAVILENHGTAAALAQMPGLRTLGRRFGYTTHYEALAHPSLPNYLGIVAGSTMGVTDDERPEAHRLPGESVFDQALAANRSAKTYAEDMPRNCALTDAGRYVVHHNPWAYFADPESRRGCDADDVPAGTTASGALHDDATRGTLPAVGLLVPNMCHDGHDCPLSEADRWLDSWVRQLMAGPDWAAGRLAVVITFDEAEDRSATNQVLTVVANPAVRAGVAQVPFTHLSLSAWLSTVAGKDPLRRATGSASLATGFGL
jgi:acid phosphatase